MIFRIHKGNNYTIIANSIFKDNLLSYKAKGLLAQMLSLPDDWNWSAKGLTTLASDGDTSVRKAIEELEKARYLVRVQQTNGKGQFAGYIYDVYETPFVDFPQTDFPITEKQAQYNNINNKELNNGVIKARDEEFEKFWNLYDRKVGREQCIRMWGRLTKKDKEEILTKLPAYIQSTPDKQFRMHPATYINPANKRWQDEIISRHEQPNSDRRGLATPQSAPRKREYANATLW